MPILAIAANYVVARAAEPSTWAAVAGVLAAVHVNVDPGVWGYVTGLGTAAAGLAGVALREGA